MNKLNEPTQVATFDGESVVIDEKSLHELAKRAWAEHPNNPANKAKRLFSLDELEWFSRGKEV